MSFTNDKGALSKPKANCFCLRMTLYQLAAFVSSLRYFNCWRKLMMRHTYFVVVMWPFSHN
jgi:hypothetical protein